MISKFKGEHIISIVVIFPKMPSEATLDSYQELKSVLIGQSSLTIKGSVVENVTTVQGILYSFKHSDLLQKSFQDSPRLKSITFCRSGESWIQFHLSPLSEIFLVFSSLTCLYECQGGPCSLWWCITKLGNDCCQVKKVSGSFLL